MKLYRHCAHCHPFVRGRPGSATCGVLGSYPEPAHPNKCLVSTCIIGTRAVEVPSANQSD